MKKALAAYEATSSEKIQVGPSNKGFWCVWRKRGTIVSTIVEVGTVALINFCWGPIAGQFCEFVEENSIPRNINTKTGWYRYGKRKCSRCKGFEDKSMYTDEQAKMPEVK